MLKSLLVCRQMINSRNLMNILCVSCKIYSIFGRLNLLYMGGGGRKETYLENL
jgi:hypothetical protein